MASDLPTRLGLIFFWTALVVSVTLLLGWFTPLVVLPVTVALLAATWRLRPAPLPATPGRVRGALAALGLSALWVAVNLPWAAQVLLVERDAGFLTLTGLWLVDHPSADVPIRSAAELASLPNVSVTSDAYWLQGDVLAAQGAKAFPGLIAMPGWLLGQPGVLAANLAIGGLALVALYDLARRLLPPGWALLPMVTLALTTPMVYFTRTPFTEPTNIVLTATGLVVAWEALRRPRVAHFALAGGLVGANALSRIDGAAVAAGLVLALGLMAGLSQDRQRRPILVRGFLAASAAALTMVVLGYLDVRLNSTGYLADHAHLYIPLIALLGVCLVAGAAAIALGRPAVLAWLGEHRVGIGTGVAVAVLVVAGLLASRPLWMTAHLLEPGSDVARFVAAFQAAAGVEVDGTRSYDERTVVWLTWYFGVGTLLLAAVGGALLARTSIVDRKPELAVLLLTLGAPTLLYLVRPAITPDQVWAMRRFLPAAMPLVVLTASWPLWRVWQFAAARPDGRDRWVTRSIRALVVLLAGLMLLAPVRAWGNQLGTGEYEGRAGQVARLCASIPPGARVVVLRGAEPPLLPTIRTRCDADVVEVRTPVTAATLAELREAWGGGEVYVVAGHRESGPWPESAPPTIAARIARWPHSLRAGGDPLHYTSYLWVGTIGDGGRLVPIATGEGS